MTKEKLALEIIGRLKKNIPMQAVPWTMTMRGSCWSVYVWRHSVQMQG